MRRAVLTFAATAALLGGGAAAHAQTPPLSAKVADCQTGADPLNRFVVFTGSMPRDDAAVMEMRFDLYERLAGGTFKHVELAHWGVWERTDRTDVPGFVFTKRVEQLDAPAGFRAVVSFRWRDAKGAVVRSATRKTDVCRQPDWRADLHIDRVLFPTLRGATQVVVRNRGRGDAGAFRVEISAGQIFRAEPVDALAAGTSITVALQIPRCREGQRVTARVDPGRRVVESHDDDNVLRLLCPSTR